MARLVHELFFAIERGVSLTDTIISLKHLSSVIRVELNETYTDNMFKTGVIQIVVDIPEDIPLKERFKLLIELFDNINNVLETKSIKDNLFKFNVPYRVLDDGTLLILKGVAKDILDYILLENKNEDKTYSYYKATDPSFDVRDLDRIIPYLLSTRIEE